MKKYKSHKVVMAGQIKSIVTHPMMAGADDQVVDIGFMDGSTLRTTGKFIERHKPALRGYIVRYGDDYMSYSPQKPFEEGYSLMESSEDHNE